MFATALLIALAGAAPLDDDQAVGTAGAAAAAAAQDVDPAQRGVIPYPPEFFAAAQPSTALDMITRLPGFTLEQGDSARGYAGTSGNVLINGERPTTKNESLEDMLRRIAAPTVERVDLIRGGAPGIDMQGRTVMANIVLKRTVQVQKVVNLQTYYYPDGFFGPILELEGSRREGDTALEGSLKATIDRTDNTYDGGVRLRANGAGVPTSKDALKAYDTIYNYVLRGAAEQPILGGKTKVNAKLEYFGYDRDVTATRVFPAPAREVTGEKLHNWTGEFGARYDRKLSDRTDLQLVALQNLGREIYGSTFDVPTLSVDYKSRTDTGETILRSELKHRRSDNLSFEAGLEGAYNVLDGDTTYFENSVSLPLPAAQVKVEELRGELSGKAIWRASPKLNVEAGARMEVSRISQSGDSDLSKSFFYPKPRVLATWSPTTTDQLRVRVEREVGQLDFGDFVSSAGTETGTVDAGNPDLVPERRWVIETAWEKRFWGGGAVVVSWRHAEIQDVVDLIPIKSVFEAPGNIGDGVNDLYQVNVTVPTDKLSISGGQLKARLSWAESEVTDPTTHVKRRISGQTPFTCNVSFTRDMPGGKWSWGASTSCQNEQRYYRIGEVRTFAYEPFLQGFFEWRPRRDLTIRTEMANLTGRHKTRTRVLYAGNRASGIVTQVETRETPFEPYLFLKVRKSFG
ncbi:TonB-dependent receptor [Caulobacter sp. 1776]|uniref:TonB-dependent receptor plug domain-containing protein n=1 Tax=Caulobacter sp. 1776 TaxID=3156420 RepID=UPI003397E179